MSFFEKRACTSMDKTNSHDPQREASGSTHNLTLDLPVISNAMRGEREDKEMRKDIKYLQELGKKIAILMSPDAGMLNTITKKYTSMYNELKQNECAMNAWQRNYDIVRKERDSLNAEKSFLSKAKLETWHQEVQRQNKRMKEELNRNTEKDRRKEELRKAASIYTINQMKNPEGIDNLRSIEMTKVLVQELNNLHVGISNENPQPLNLEQFYKIDAKQAEEEKEALIREKNLLETKLQQIESVNDLQRHEIISLEKTIDGLEKRYLDLELGAQEEKNRIRESYEEKLNEMNVVVKELKGNVEEWKMKYDECVQKVLQLTTYNREKQREFEQMQTKLSQLHKQYRMLQNEKSRCIKKLKNYVLDGSSQDDDTSKATPEGEDEIVQFLQEQYLELSRGERGLIEDNMRIQVQGEDSSDISTDDDILSARSYNQQDFIEGDVEEVKILSAYSSPNFDSLPTD